jgi:hypothetical protein
MKKLMLAMIWLGALSAAETQAAFIGTLRAGDPYTLEVQGFACSLTILRVTTRGVLVVDAVATLAF